MSCCSIRWCGKNSKTSNYETDRISFHRFPKDPNLRKQWIDCTKRENWFPSNYSVVCSRHFTEDCFDTSKSRRRLFDTAIPTLNLPVVSNIPVPEYASSTASLSPQMESLLTPRTTKRKATDTETLSQTNKRLCRRVLQLTIALRSKNKVIKLLQDKVRYYKKRVASLKNMKKEPAETITFIKVEDAVKLEY